MQKQLLSVTLSLYIQFDAEMMCMTQQQQHNTDHILAELSAVYVILTACKKIRSDS